MPKILSHLSHGHSNEFAEVQYVGFSVNQLVGIRYVAQLVSKYLWEMKCSVFVAMCGNHSMCIIDTVSAARRNYCTSLH